MTSDTGAPVPLLTPVTRVAIAAVGAYVGAQVIADVTSLKIGSVTGRAGDLGTFLYPLTFTLRHLVHQALGRRAARTHLLKIGRASCRERGCPYVENSVVVVQLNKKIIY